MTRNQKVRKIDLHVHCVPEHDIPKLTGHFYPTPDEVRKIYDSINVEKGVLLPPGTSPEFTTERLSPREVRAMVRDRNDTIGWWFCGIDPRFGGNDPDTDFSHYLLYYKAQGARGVSEQVANLTLDDPRMMNLLRHCGECDMPVTLHFGAAGEYGILDEIGLPRLERVLAEIPKVKIIGHSARFWAELDEKVDEATRNDDHYGKVTTGGRVVELMRKYPNLWCDLSCSAGTAAMERDPDFTVRFLTEFSDRVLFATDIYDPENFGMKQFDLSLFLDELMESGKLDWDVYYKVSRGNALRLLGEEPEL